MHPLEKVISESEGFVLIGDSANGRFPGFSYNAYVKAKKAFFCLDLGGLTESRGPTKGGKVYTSVADLPEYDDLAIIWVKPHAAKNAVDLAHEAGCKRVWFSFDTGHRDAVKHARDLGMEVVEIGRCPGYYLKGAPPACAAHTLLAKVTGNRRRPPQIDEDADRREIW
ncbi:MAG: CoA-binding protein [Proteobacteria bacterium]|nr:CoA-binding protein [Pseudomonadota bacterium]